jgi:hypothetical protein
MRIRSISEIDRAGWLRATDPFHSLSSGINTQQLNWTFARLAEWSVALAIRPHKPGFKTQVSQVYSSDAPNLQTDVQFGVTPALIGHYVRHENETATGVRGPWYSLEHTFVIEAGEAKLPRPPITGKSTAERPALAVLTRR